MQNPDLGRNHKSLRTTTKEMTTSTNTRNEFDSIRSTFAMFTYQRHHSCLRKYNKLGLNKITRCLFGSGILSQPPTPKLVDECRKTDKGKFELGEKQQQLKQQVN